jgi:Uma2 family endonuclease
MTRLASTPPSPPEPPDANPFRYGWRYVTRTRPDGSEEHVEVPLTLEDVLHPQEGDVIPENTQQEKDRRYLHDVLERRYENDPHVLTLSDCLVDWGVRGLRAHSPDITVIEGVPTREGSWGTYRIARDGGRPLLVIEIVSPDTRGNDVDIKPEHYHRAGIPLYVIVDQQREDGPRWLTGYEHRADGYVQLPPGADGRLTLAPVGIRLGLRDGRVVCWDAESDQELGDYVGVCRQLEQEIAAREEAQRQARKAERQARKAERQAKVDADARREAEKRQKAEARARRAAEREAKEAIDRVRELEEQLRRLQGGGPTS